MPTGGADHGGRMTMSENDNPSATDDAQTIDTDVAALTDELRYAPAGEPFGIELGLASYTVERIDLEREAGETVPDWIRHAIDDRLAEHGADAATANAIEGPRVDVEHTNDTPGEEISKRLADADRHEYIPVEVELPGRVVEAISDLDRDGHTVGHWIRAAVWVRFSHIDDDLERNVLVELEVPDEIAVRARLRAEHRTHRKGGDYDDALMDSLNELASPYPEYVLESGDVLATHRDDGDS